MVYIKIKIALILAVLILLCDVPALAESAPVRIAVIDSGIRTECGCIDAVRIAEGKNYVFENAGTEDLIGHGTNVAGVILGAAPENVSLIPLVCFSKYSSGVSANSGVKGICDAVYDAVDVYGCRIVNLSSGIDREDDALRVAVSYAEEKGVIVISAVGNNNLNAPERVFYPAAYETVVGVGAADGQGEVSAFSQRNFSVMVTAPGEDIELPAESENGAVKTVSGTSYAAARVTALAAAVLSECPSMTPAEFRELLESSSDDLGAPGYDTDYGWGLIDTAKALKTVKETRGNKSGDA